MVCLDECRSLVKLYWCCCELFNCLLRLTPQSMWVCKDTWLNPIQPKWELALCPPTDALSQNMLNQNLDPSTKIYLNPYIQHLWFHFHITKIVMFCSILPFLDLISCWMSYVQLNIHLTFNDEWHSSLFYICQSHFLLV